MFYVWCGKTVGHFWGFGTERNGRGVSQFLNQFKVLGKQFDVFTLDLFAAVRTLNKLLSVLNRILETLGANVMFAEWH